MMGKCKFVWMLSTAVACILMLGSCRDISSTVDNPVVDYGDNDQEEVEENAISDAEYAQLDGEVIDEGEMQIEDIYEDMIDDHSDMTTAEDTIYTDYAQARLYEMAFNDARSRTRANTDGEGEDGVSGEDLIMCLKYTTVRYTTVSVDGTKKKMSELIVWPYYKVQANPNPKNLIIGCHCTITSDHQRPTNFKDMTYKTDVGMLALYAQAGLLTGNCLVAIPDYEGYGLTHDSPHPYCNRDVTARQVIDGARFAVGWYERKQKKMSKDWKSVAIGYSQGGAVAAGVARYYFENKMSGLNFQGSICGDGPYDPLATLNQYIKDDKMYMPVAVALLLKGAVDTNKEMKALGCQYKDFVKDEFFDTGIFEWLDEKQMTTDDIQKALQEHSKLYGGDPATGSKGGFTMHVWNKQTKTFMPYAGNAVEEYKGNWELTTDGAYSYCTIEQCLRPEALECFKTGKVPDPYDPAKLDALKQALLENSLTYNSNWLPSQGKTPLIFFHSTRDEVVLFCNYESVRDAWGIDRIQGHPYTAGSVYLHVGTGGAFYAWHVNTWTYPLLKGPQPTGEEEVTGRIF